MLIEFKVENYRSFAEEQTFSMVAAKDTSHPDHVVDCGKFGLLKAAAVYGANASGKSNLLRAFRVMRSLVVHSATTMTQGNGIWGAEPFRLHHEWLKKPTSFGVVLLLDGTEYQYGYSATFRRVYDEWLYVKRKGGRSINKLLREYDPVDGKTAWSFHGELKEAEELKEKTRDNGLFLSRAAEMNVAYVAQLFEWFQKRLRHFDWTMPPFFPRQRTARGVCEDDAFRASVEALLCDADLGIEGISARKDEVKSVRDFVSYLPSLAQGMHGYGDAGSEDFQRITVRTRHRVADSDETVEFLLEDESNGTQRFFALAGPVLDALHSGGLLVVDELECSMHPLLTRKLVELFQSSEANPNGAQLVFATHDSTLMSPALFRRDQIWLTEKTKDGATSLFSLSDIEPENRPRQSEAFEKNYLAGRYGGVPNFGPSFEDLEVK